MTTAMEKQSLQTITNSIGTFSADCYKELSKDEAANIICSPMSVSMVLSMITFGAGGDTAKELRTALHLVNDDQVNHNGFQYLINTLNSMTAVDLRIANKLFIAKEFDIKSEFKTIMEVTFRSALDSIDFKNTVNASKIINNWCSEKTNNRIKDIVQPDVLQDVMLVLVNAIYFKGNWAKKFNSSLTGPAPFHINTKMTKDVPMMKRVGRYNYGEIPDLNAAYIELPYQSNGENESMSMFIILPNEIEGLKNIENNLNMVNYKQLHDNRYSMEIDLQLPKFKIESQFDLENPLMTLGMKSMFDNSANFSGISDIPLKVSKVIQKAFIEVNEEGSEAAAVTAVLIVPMCAPLPPIPVIVNKPFFYTIATNTGAQLFKGRVIDPTLI